MSEWRAGVPIRGVTAQKLVELAEAEMGRRDRAAQLKMARQDQDAKTEMERMAKVVAKSGVSVEELQRSLDQQRKENERVKEDLSETRQELRQSRSPRRDAVLRDGSTMLEFHPAKDSGSAYFSYWTIEEMDSMIMHMRMMGADDRSIVEVTDSSIKIRVRDDGLPLPPWKPTLGDKSVKPAKQIKDLGLGKYIAFQIGTAIAATSLLVGGGVALVSLL